MLIAMFQKAYTDSIDFIMLILILLSFFMILLLINRLFDWLKTEPWKRSKPPEDGLAESESPNPSDQIQEDTDSRDNLLIDGASKTLLAGS